MKSFIKFLDQNSLNLALLTFSDLLGMMMAFLVAYGIRNNLIGPAIQPIGIYAKALPGVALILLVTFYFFGLYERRQRITPLSELYNLMRAITFVWIFIMAASFLVKTDYSRILVILFYGLGLITITGGRYCIRRFYQALHRKGIGLTRVLIIGVGKSGKRVADQLKHYESFGYRVIGFVDDHAKAKGAQNLLGGLNELKVLTHSHEIQEIFVADPSISHEKILELIQDCEKMNVKFKVVSDLFEIVAGDIDLNELEGLPSLNLARREPTWIYKAIKRVLDIVLSGIALVVFFPVWIVIVLLIRLESKGPALFIHDRVGKDGGIFKLHKFRTMRQEVNAQAHAPKSNADERVTRIGRWLRKTSLDEVPQFWDVIKGGMTLVGPRPEMPFIVKNYKEWQRRRLDVKPGITGLWQILGRKDLPLHENIEYDFYYIKNQSLLLDIVILLKTISVVIKGRGAY